MIVGGEARYRSAPRERDLCSKISCCSTLCLRWEKVPFFVFFIGDELFVASSFESHFRSIIKLDLMSDSKFDLIFGRRGLS